MNQTRAHRSSTRNQRTNASRPTMPNRRYSSADQAEALGSTMPKNTEDLESVGGMMDGDEVRAKRKLRSDFHDMPAAMRAMSIEMDRDRTRGRLR